MKRIFSTLAFLLIFCSVCFCQQYRVAVYVLGPLEVYFNTSNGISSAGVSKDDKKLIEGAISSALTHNGNFKVADRSDAIQTAITQEYSTQSSGSVNFDQIVKLGRQIGAEYLCVVEIDKHVDDTSIVGKLINVEENSVISARNFSVKFCYLPEHFQNVGKYIAKELIKQMPENKTKKLAKIVGPFNFQEAMDYEIPNGYSTFDEGVNRGEINFPEVINKLFDAGKFVSGGWFVSSRSKLKSNNRVIERMSTIRNDMKKFSDYEKSCHNYKDYYSFSYEYGERSDFDKYTLEFDKHGNVRYINSNGKKEDKDFIPRGRYYIILLPDD